MLRVTMLTLRLPATTADAAGLPLHARVAAALRRALAEGEVTPGSLLPPARDLAVALDVHPNTVLRAYRTLRDEGLVDLRAGRGARVLPGADAPAGLTGPIDALLAAAADAGLDLEAVLARVSDRALAAGGRSRPVSRPPSPPTAEEASS